MHTQSSPNRREFLKKSALLTAAGGTPLALQLAGMSKAAAQVPGDDYKALVCIFLYGGNDAINTVVPLDANQYNLYANRRQSIAWPSNTLTPLSPLAALPSGMRFGLPTDLAPLARLFNTDRKLAVLMNVGPLARSGTNSSNWTQPVYEPPKLFSHNDQESLWQSLRPEGDVSGWGGRLADRVMAANGQGASFTCINAAGNAVFLSGQQAVPYSVSRDGRAAVLESRVFGSNLLPGVMQQIATQTGSQHWFEDEHAYIMRRAIDNGARFNQNTSPLAEPHGFETSNPLAMQLKAVAQTIAARSNLGLRRQVFFVAMGGFDTHRDQTDRHSPLLGRLANAMTSFYDATVALGIANAVTTFTASDFGRTLTINGNGGTDHGWGAHHFIMGGAVNGRRFYGQAPALQGSGNSIGFGAQDAGNGRLIPTTSIEQLGVRLGRWFGVPEAALTGGATSVFPNASAFNLTTLNGLLTS
jgi:uncharacterized protein (DUF1501 family)